MNSPSQSNLIRVLHVLGGKMDLGGIEVFLMNYFRHINSNLFVFDFMITERGVGFFDDEIKSLNGKIFNVVSKRKRPVAHIFESYKLFKKYKYMPIHLHLDGMNGFYSLIARLAGAKKIISHSHNTDHLTTNIVKRLIHGFFIRVNRMTSHYYAACSADASVWLHGKQITSFKWMPNAINTDDFRFDSSARNQWRNSLNIADAFVIGHIGRFHEQKNHKFMIEIAIKLKSIGFDFKMLFIGSGELMGDIEESITEYDLQKEVTLLGRRSDANKLLSSMDLFVFPSHYEGLGIAAIEAQYNGLSVISSNAIPNEAMISDRINKLELKVDEWVNAILESAQNVSLSRKTFSLKNNSYDITEAVHELETYYRELL